MIQRASVESSISTRHIAKVLTWRFAIIGVTFTASGSIGSSRINQHNCKILHYVCMSPQSESQFNRVCSEAMVRQSLGCYIIWGGEGGHSEGYLRNLTGAAVSNDGICAPSGTLEKLIHHY